MIKYVPKFLLLQTIYIYFFLTAMAYDILKYLFAMAIMTAAVIAINREQELPSTAKKGNLTSRMQANSLEEQEIILRKGLNNDMRGQQKVSHGDYGNEYHKTKEESGKNMIESEKYEKIDISKAFYRKEPSSEYEKDMSDFPECGPSFYGCPDGPLPQGCLCYDSPSTGRSRITVEHDSDIALCVAALKESNSTTHHMLELQVKGNINITDNYFDGVTFQKIEIWRFDFKGSLHYDFLGNQRNALQRSLLTSVTFRRTQSSSLLSLLFLICVYITLLLMQRNFS